MVYVHSPVVRLLQLASYAATMCIAPLHVSIINFTFMSYVDDVMKAPDSDSIRGLFIRYLLLASFSIVSIIAIVHVLLGTDSPITQVFCVSVGVASALVMGIGLAVAGVVSRQARDGAVFEYAHNRIVADKYVKDVLVRAVLTTSIIPLAWVVIATTRDVLWTDALSRPVAP